jgi:curli biogenesis system outer membrane secretion channel CsgG
MNTRLPLAFALSWILGGCATEESSQRKDPTASRASRQRADADAEEREAEAAAPPPRLHGPKKRIGIVDFDDASHHAYWGGGRNALAETARDVATEAMVKSGAFVVIEREQIAQVLKEQGLGMTGALSPQTAAKAGKLLGLQALVTGKITDFDTDEKRAGFGGYYQSHTRTFHARVSLRFIDATTGEIWAAESGEGAATQKSTTVMGGGQQSIDQTLGKRALYMAVHHMINKVLVKVDSKPWSGAVAKVAKGGRIYITAGSDIGLPVGATLTVRRLGEEITDPATGQVIGHELGKTVGKLQVADHLNEKLSVCVSTRGAGFSSGDLVTLDSTKVAEAPADASSDD